MIRCCCLVELPKTQARTWDTTKQCPKYAKHFYTVIYESLTDYYAARRSKYDKIYGFCPNHQNYAILGNFSRRDSTKVRTVLGHAHSITPIDLSKSEAEALARDDQRQEKLAGIKAGIVRLMEQSNTSNLSVDEWEEVFRKCIEERTVKIVQES